MGFGNSVDIGEIGLKTATIIGHDTLAADQFLDLRRASTLTPEKRLLYAVLEDAMHSIAKRTTDAYGAMEWVRSPDDHPFSFIHVCDVIGISVSAARTKLEAQYTRSLPAERLAERIEEHVRRKIGHRQLRPLTLVMVMRWHALRGVPAQDVMEALDSLVERGVLAKQDGMYVNGVRRRA